MIKIASIIDEHTRQSLLNNVERSITAKRLTDEPDKAFPIWGWFATRAADGQRTRVHIYCAATVLPRPGRYRLHPAGYTVERRSHRIVQQPFAE
ncbi:hypothetical protein D8W71_02165 [Rhodococcus sp. P1Y]|nr:hypothetical protein D8W71_02165 [Rhodococcus sp. P1Y]